MESALETERLKHGNSDGFCLSSALFFYGLTGRVQTM